MVPVVAAGQAGARDRAAIDAGIPSRALMQRAGAAAASLIAMRWPRRLAGGVAVYAGSGNNGGDAWVVAAALAATGVPVRVEQVGEARTDDARAERAHARAAFAGLGDDAPDGTEAIIVDGLLGTGARGAPRGAVADAVARIATRRERGARVVALDIPSGVDASTGDDEGAVTADLTVTFGTMKRGLLVARDRVGALAVIDIGLGAHATPADDRAPLLIDAAWVRERIPAVGARAHKGTRGRLAIVGGARGMAGAVVLAARAALRAGAGLVKVVVAPECIAAVQGAVPEAIAAAWPEDDAAARRELGEWAHGLLLGPGLGGGARALVERALGATRAPAVLDADALNAFAGDAGAMRAHLAGRPALLTPHPGEMARLIGGEANTVDRERWDVIGPLARRTGTAVLLKGVPTVVGDADGARWVSASGTPALAVGGSGDLLSGIAATLVMQREEAVESGACAAWLHGRAAELASEAGVRGATLADVLDALPRAWREPVERPPYPVLAMLPAVPGA
jgi:NAD(P)H-hydrate epimerase